MAKTPGKKPDSAHFLEKVIEVATFYGFRPYTEILERPKIVKDARPVCIPIEKVRHIDATRKQGSIIESYLKINALQREEPKLLYFFTQPRSKDKEYENDGRLNLEIFGLSTSIGEAILIRTCLSMLEEIGYANMFISVNSIGDKESIIRFSREYIAYYKRHGLELHAPCRENLKKSLWKMFLCKNERCMALREEAPQSMSYLSESSRLHFREVLEFLETMQVAYEIDNNLIRDLDRFCETLFEIRQIVPPIHEGDKSTSEILARGGRYNYFARRVGSKKDVPAVGVSLTLRSPANSEKALHPNKKKPKVYFIQLGHDAARKSFSVLEILRKTRVPLLQSHGANQLMGQLGIAEKLCIPYTMIMGQREAVDGTVIVRNTNTREQQTVPISELPAHLETLIE